MRLFYRTLLIFPALFFCLAGFTSAQTLTEKLIAENPTELAKQAREKGNIVRGAILYHQGNINCAKCHRATADKDRIGPDLSKIESNVTDELIIESILQPSKQFRKGYEPIVVLTKDGELFSGIKVSDDDKAIQIRET